MSEFSHIDSEGKASMVNVGHKVPLKRTAIAQGKIFLQPETLALIKKNNIAKGDVLSVARIAGITGGKKTSDLIPLCHNILIDQIQVDFVEESDGIIIRAVAFCTGKTGIEMEALTAVSLSALTIWDMCKAVDKAMKIGEIILIEKRKED
ncbi:MAG: cyclic pyranopterin monophosphate synthase MoaC [Brevinema sp.]